MKALSNGQIRCELDEVLNSEYDEAVVYFIWESKEIEYDDREIAEEIQRKGDGLILPEKERLCPYGEVMYDYLSERGIEVPERRTAKGYLWETGYLYDFYEYWRKLLIQEMKAWLRYHKIVGIELI